MQKDLLNAIADINKSMQAPLFSIVDGYVQFNTALYDDADEQQRAALKHFIFSAEVRGAMGVRYAAKEPHPIETLTERYWHTYNPKGDVRFLLEWQIPSGKWVGVMPENELVTLTGQSKSGKSTAVCLILAAYLKGEYCGLRATAGGDRCALHIDTEQSERQTHTMFVKGLRQLIGDAASGLQCINLKPNSREEKWELVRDAVELYRPELVIIDGTNDLMLDINDQAETKAVTTLYNQLLRHACVINVMHQNYKPKSSKDEGKVSGAIGSELYKKSDVLVCDKNGGVMSLKWDRTRTRTPENPIKFKRYLNEEDDHDPMNGMPMPYNESEAAESEAAKYAKEHAEKLAAVIGKMTSGKPYTTKEVCGFIHEVFGIKERAARRIIEELLAKYPITQEVKSGKSTIYTLNSEQQKVDF